MSAITGQVVLEGIRRVACEPGEQNSQQPFLHCFCFCSCLRVLVMSSYFDFPQWRTVNQTWKPNKTFSPQVAFGHAIITAVETKLEHMTNFNEQSPEIYFNVSFKKIARGGTVVSLLSS